MNRSLTYMAKSTITYSLLATSLLATVLSGCAYLTETNDNSIANCPVTELPTDRQPFDLSARKIMQQLIKRDTRANKDATDNTTFVRLNAQGTPLTTKQAEYNRAPWAKDYRTVPWSCIKDNRTGLIWEVKTNDQFLRDNHWTYTWSEPTQVGKGGYAGKTNGGKCKGSACDTQAYVAAVNAEKLCGHDDWRLPHIVELHTLLNRKDNCPGTCIEQRYFPNAAIGGYWSSSPFEEFICYAWGLDFELADASGAHKNTPLFIRLVRGKWPATSDDSENVSPQ